MYLRVHTQREAAMFELKVAAFTPGVRLPGVNHRQLRSDLKTVLDEVTSAHGAVEVTNRGQREAVLVDHEVFDGLLQEADELRELRSVMAMLVAAAEFGAAVPSELLAAAGVRIPVDLDKLERFRADYPVAVTHDEEGHRLVLSELGPDAVLSIPEAEDEDALDFGGA